MGARFVGYMPLVKTNGFVRVSRTDVENAASAACVWVWHFPGFYGLQDASAFEAG